MWRLVSGQELRYYTSTVAPHPICSLHIERHMLDVVTLKLLCPVMLCNIYVDPDIRQWP